MPEFGRPKPPTIEEALAEARERYTYQPTDLFHKLAADLTVGNVSLLVDVAIKHFATLDEHQQRALVSIELANRIRVGKSQ